MKFCQDHWDRLVAALTAHFLTDKVKELSPDFKLCEDFSKWAGVDGENSDPLVMYRWVLSHYIVTQGGWHNFDDAGCPICQTLPEPTKPEAGTEAETYYVFDLIRYNHGTAILIEGIVNDVGMELYRIRNPSPTDDSSIALVLRTELEQYPETTFYGVKPDSPTLVEPIEHTHPGEISVPGTE